MFRPLGFPHAKIFHRGRRVSGIRTLFVFYHPAPSRFRLLICFDKLIFSYSADGAFKIIRQILELHSEGDAEFSLAFFVVYPTAYLANVPFHFDLSFLFIFQCRSTVMPPISHVIISKIDESVFAVVFFCRRTLLLFGYRCAPRKKRRIPQRTSFNIAFRFFALCFLARQSRTPPRLHCTM